MCETHFTRSTQKIRPKAVLMRVLVMSNSKDQLTAAPKNKIKKQPVPHTIKNYNNKHQ